MNRTQTHQQSPAILAWRDQDAAVVTSNAEYIDSTLGPNTNILARFIVGAKGQAKRITKSFALIKEQRRRLRLRGIVYFSWRDAVPYPPNYKNHWGLHTGLLRINGSRKPAYHAFKKAVARLR